MYHHLQRSGGQFLQKAGSTVAAGGGVVLTKTVVGGTLLTTGIAGATFVVGAVAIGGVLWGTGALIDHLKKK